MMKNYNLFTIIMVLTTGMLLETGCKKQDPQPVNIYQHYVVQYFIDRDKSRADAYFNYVDRNGIPVTFVDRKVVRVNGDTSEVFPSSTGQQVFAWDINGTPEMVFTLDRSDGMRLTNKVNRAMMGDLSLEIDSVLYVGDTMRARWTGTPLLAQEGIGIAMNRESDSTGLYSGVSGSFLGPDTENGHLCTFDFAETSKFHPGIYYVSLTKTRSLPLQERDGSAGGSISVSIGVLKRVVVK